MDCSNEYAEPMFGLGERAIAMRTQDYIVKGQEYRVSQLNSDGTISVSVWREASNEFVMLAGSYDPKCFRRE